MADPIKSTLIDKHVHGANWVPGHICTFFPLKTPTMRYPDNFSRSDFECFNVSLIQ